LLPASYFREKFVGQQLSSFATESAQSVDIGMSAFPPLLKGKPDIARTGDDFRV